MLSKNSAKLFESHAILTMQVLDTEGQDPFVIGETTTQTAQKLKERADHLTVILGAAVAYARVIVDDIQENTWEMSILRLCVGRLLDDVSDLVGAIEKFSEAAGNLGARR